MAAEMTCNMRIDLTRQCYSYDPTSNPNIQVTQKLWCSLNSNTAECLNPPYVYNSSSNTSSDFEYAGDDKSNCTLLIHNLQFSYSGEYRFRFITANPDDRYTGVPGATLQVADLKVSLIRLSGNGTLKQGDSLNLTCDVNCTHSSSQFMWSKNNKLLPESGPVLHFPALTVRDSGNYTCTWKTNEASRSETISLHVEGENPDQWLIWIIVSVSVGVIFIVSVIVGAVIYRSVHTEQQKKEDAADIYVNVQENEDGANIYANVQKEEDGDGVLTQDKSRWSVKYPDNPICAVRGFSVSIPCSYYYDPTSNPNIQLRKKFWCSMNSNTDFCLNPPYVYNSSSNTNSDFESAGDDKSNCTLLIHNLQFSYSGEYRFRFITANPDDRRTGDPGATLQVADLKVSLIRLSGNGTLKQGDSLNLTCDVNCTHSSSQFMWSKNNKLLPESGPVLHFPALTVRDSGNYTCTWKTNEASRSETISLHVEGGRWSVKYPDNPICAVRGFSVSIPCSYSYDPKANPNIQLRKKFWCSLNSNTGTCVNPPYVYDSSSNTNSDFEYAGDDKSNCTLLIHNLQFSYSGEYRFRFITANPEDRWTGVPGATLQVADLKVSLIRLSGNGTLKQGDSLNLMCDVNCRHSSSQFMWSKNNELLPESGPVLHFPALTVRDSGKYTCTWKTNEASESETISLHVEGENPDQWLIWIIVSVSVGVIFIVSVIVGAVIYIRRCEELKEDDSDIYTTVQYNTFTIN
ncbi:uncharacterized protein LOC132867650 [Neoarius graeffei]|uniref:uncharacterized protein LOC132867650 n=1 Tax=Neoarius graeffei TaxID=443677 RepID=UPI00298BF1FA|nr:uncharacterized protein LOC132867650 [Neoarius graeffei]